MRPGEVGYWSGLTAFAATLGFDVVQTLQLGRALVFPYDEVLIYGTSLCIVVPFILEMLAFHHSTANDKRFWTHAALIFATLYAVFVSANYVVQLATVVPAKVAGSVADLRILEQTPHSLFWDFDALGYVFMGLATLVGIPAIERTGFERWVRRAFIANAAVAPLIATVYFYPTFSERLLLLGLPWAFTAPLFMIMLAIMLRKRARAAVTTPL